MGHPALRRQALARPAWRLAAVLASLAALLLGLAGPAAGAPPAPAAEPHRHGATHPGDRLSAADFKGTPKDLVLWGDLARAGVTRSGGRFHVTFLPPVLALEGRTVTLVGFMAPVHAGPRHRQFLLSDRRFLCEGCEGAVPAPQSIVEVNLRVPEPLRARPVMLRGVLALVRNDANGLLYRLDEARVIRRTS